MNLDPQILRAAQWVQAQLNKPENGFSDCGFVVSSHNHEIRRVDYTLTQKIKPTQHGGRHENTQKY